MPASCSYPPCVRVHVHLVMDNASTHKTPAIKRWLLAHPRFTVHFTPTSSSWLNPRRTLVLRTDHQEAPTRSTPQRPSPQHRHPRLDQHLEREPPPLRVDQDQRPDPRLHRPLLPTDYRLRTLAARGVGGYRFGGFDGHAGHGCPSALAGLSKPAGRAGRTGL